MDVEASWLDLTDDPSVQGLVVTVRDVGERTNLEDQLRHQAFHDPLTGLPNRSLFEDRVRHAVARTRRARRAAWPSCSWTSTTSRPSTTRSATPPATSCCARWPSAWTAAVRGSDTVARLGGDEFAVLVEEPDDPDEARADRRPHPRRPGAAVR